eukprot:5933101-Pyramimonas_sp.AAC.1
MEPPWGPLGRSWKPLGPSWSPLGPFLGPRGGLSGRCLGACWAVVVRRDAERRTPKCFQTRVNTCEFCILGACWAVLEAPSAVCRPS